MRMDKYIKIGNYIGYSYFDINGNIVPDVKNKKKITTPENLGVKEEYYTDREFKTPRGFVRLTFPNGKRRTIRTW